MSNSPPDTSQQSHGEAGRKKSLAAMSIGALGVVYGDIGTSPIYSLREVFHALREESPTEEHILGVLSLVFWSLMVIISVKYVVFVLRADNRGQGGILAMRSLVERMMPTHRADRPWLLFAGLFGTALLFGDGMITPAISVLSAVEGLKVATPAFDPYVVPITVGILVGLFSIQNRGTEKVGRLFGPIVLLWFTVLALLGGMHIGDSPAVLQAFLPHHGVKFLWNSGWIGFAVLGSVFLVMTGGEAMYADLGHFGAKPIRVAWFALVLPALVLNYFGQGAMLLSHPGHLTNPFYNMVPAWALYPVVVLATAATVIASQALISGTFSVTAQALQLKFLPRVRVEQTSEHEIGQIYVPFINWALMVACVLLVVAFQNSSSLAAAYGVAVTLDMVITSTLLFFFLRHGAGWSRWRAGALCIFFLVIELVFLAGNIIKIPHGGWFPLLVGGLFFMVMSTWQKGRQRIANLRRESGVLLATIIQNMDNIDVVRVPGTAIFMHADPERVPPALLHNVQHNMVLHRNNLIVTVVIEDQPYVAAEEVARVEDLGQRFYRVILKFGYMDRPDVPAALRGLKVDDRPLDSGPCSYFLSRETILPRHWLWSGMALWREKLFALMARNAEDATAYFNIPPTMVMEVGSQIEI